MRAGKHFPLPTVRSRGDFSLMCTTWGDIALRSEKKRSMFFGTPRHSYCTVRIFKLRKTRPIYNISDKHATLGLLVGDSRAVTTTPFRRTRFTPFCSRRFVQKSTGRFPVSVRQYCHPCRRFYLPCVGGETGRPDFEQLPQRSQSVRPDFL